MNAIILLARRNGGLVTASQVVAAGIPRARLSDLVKNGQLKRVERGVYCLPDAWDDEFKVTQLRFPKGTFSDETALYLHDYSDRTPSSLTMTFSRSYRATTARRAGIEVRTCADEVMNLGVTTISTPCGNEVRCFDLERTLCDLLRGHSSIDVQVVNPAMRRYLRSKDRDIQKLLDYARKLGVERKIRTYLEVLL